MPHYVAIVEEEPGRAVGVWFPDVPGCFSAGDTPDEALRNAVEALAGHAESLADDGRALPPPRSLAALRADQEVAPDLDAYMVALVPHDPPAFRTAAE